MSTRISAGVDDCPCFTTFIALIPIDCKIIHIGLHCMQGEDCIVLHSKGLN